MMVETIVALVDRRVGAKHLIIYTVLNANLISNALPVRLVGAL
jgi:hypothetical protein